MNGKTIDMQQEPERIAKVHTDGAEWTDQRSNSCILGSAGHEHRHDV